MQKCTKCGSEFKWKEILKSIMSSNDSLVCKNCGIQYHEKIIFRIINAFILPIPWLITDLLHLHSYYSLFGFIISEVLIVLLMPFWTKFRIYNEQHYNSIVSFITIIAVIIIVILCFVHQNTTRNHIEDIYDSLFNTYERPLRMLHSIRPLGC